MDNQTSLQSLHDGMVSLAHKHASVSFLLIAVLAAFMVLAGLGGYVAVKHFDKLEARAEQADAQYARDKKDMQEQIKTLQGQINDRSKQSQAIAVNTDRRDKATAKRVGEVQAAQEPVNIEQDLKDAYKFQGEFHFFDSASGLFRFNTDQVKTFTTTKIEHDSLQADLLDATSRLGLEHQNYLDVQSQLTKVQASQKECEAVKKDFKNAAKASKWKRFFGGAGKVVAVGAGILLGYEIGHKL